MQISVEEVPEVEQPNTPVNEHMLCIPESSSTSGAKTKGLGSKNNKRPKEIPEWVLKLTQQYNVTVHTEGAKNQMIDN